MARTKIDVVNEALAMVGGNDIAELDDDSAEGKAAAAHYETVVGSALLNPGGGPFRWSWATREDTLTRLADPPLGRWSYAYQLPVDCLRLHAVLYHGRPVEHATHGAHLVTDNDGPLTIEYTCRALETHWPADFAQAVTMDLASRFALTLNENADLSANLGKAANWQGVRTGDSQARSSPRLRATRLTGARNGGHWMRGRY